MPTYRKPHVPRVYGTNILASHFKELEEHSHSVPPLQLPHQLGAWAKPVQFTPPAILTEASSPGDEKDYFGIDHSPWPSLKEGSHA